MSITNKLAKQISDYHNPASLGSRFRAKRITPLLEMVEETFNTHGFVKLVDIGGTQNYWGIVPRQFFERHNTTITIVNLPGNVSQQEDILFTHVEADGCDLSCFADQVFHIAHSNSVIEHVGDWERMLRFSVELRRVSVAYFVQTPNFWFPVEPHCMTPFFHWLPIPLRIGLVRRFQLGHWEKASSVDKAVRLVESARLLTKDMFQELFPDARIHTERLFGLPKSFIAIKKAGNFPI
ncbi:MAG: class I SAM-dependent methyltransferase [Chloroflexota bacterium]